MDEPPLLRKCRLALRSFDTATDEVSEAYPCAIILLASYFQDAVERKLSEDLGYDLDFVHGVGVRLRESKIWIGNCLNPIVSQRWKDENGGISFLLDTNVAAGDMICLDAGDTDPKYKITEAGQRNARRIISNNLPRQIH